MKQIILIISVCLVAIACSCTDDNLIDNQENNNRKCSVTFEISKSNDSDFNVSTRSAGTVVTDDYSVRFYLFQQINSEYRLVRTQEVTTPILTLDNLTLDAEYKYIFLAIYNPDANVATANVLKAIDFSSGVIDDGSYDVTLPTKEAYIKNEGSTDPDEQKGSLLENCFINFMGDNSKPTYGIADDGTDEVITINQNIEIFGTGAYFLPGSYSASIGVVMERQIGVVEFHYKDAQAGDELTCSFSSDYYRLYLSQMIKDKTNPNYTSENYAIFQPPVSDMNDKKYSEGDYYSALRVFKSTYILPLTFTKTTTLTGSEKTISIYVPYTTAEAAGTVVDEKYQANHIRTGLYGYNLDTDPSLTTGYVTLKVKRNGVENIFQTANPTAFPIYRNAKTIFTASDTGGLTISFGSDGSGGSEGGIHIPDDDIWNGDTN